MSSDTDAVAIDEQAAYWSLQSEHAMSDEQHQAMHAWLAADSRHAQAFHAMQRVSTRLDQIRQQVADQRQTTAHRPAPATHYRWAMACGLLLCLFLGWSYLPSSPTYRQAMQSQLAQQPYLLPDGSEIVLDRHSKAHVTFYDDRRELVLEYGQALFDISEDATRPFVVMVNGARVSVLGTRFMVRSEAEDIRVDVASGQVEVSQQAQTRQLTAGESLRIHQNQWSATRHIAKDSVASWQQQRLVFDDVPLPEALAEFARYGAPPVQLADQRLRDLRVTGSFRYDQPEQFWALLPKVLPVRLEQQADQITLHSR